MMVAKFVVFTAAAFGSYAAAEAAAQTFCDAINESHTHDADPVTDWTQLLPYYGGEPYPGNGTKLSVPACTWEPQNGEPQENPDPATIYNDFDRAPQPPSTTLLTESEFIADSGWFPPGPTLAPLSAKPPKLPGKSVLIKRLNAKLHHK